MCQQRGEVKSKSCSQDLIIQMHAKTILALKNDYKLVMILLPPAPTVKVFFFLSICLFDGHKMQFQTYELGLANYLDRYQLALVKKTLPNVAECKNHSCSI